MSSLALKESIRGLSFTSRELRKQGNKYLNHARNLSGYTWYSKKHNKGEEKPNPVFSQAAIDAKAWADKNPEKWEDEQTSAYKKYWNLTNTRKHLVRKQTRHALLAYGYMRGLAYHDIESQGCYELPDFDAVQKVVLDFSSKETEDAKNYTFEEWKAAALEALGRGVAKIADAA